MPRSPFVHLHVRSEYSLLRSTLRLRALVQRAADYGMHALALTDWMNLHGLVPFYDLCYRHGIKPLVGAELAVAPAAPCVEVDPHAPPAYELVVLAEDLRGYQRLCELLTRAHLQPGPAQCIVQLPWLEELAGHWIFLSGGRDGELFQTLRNGNPRQARAAAERLAHLAGPGRFFIELQWHQLPDERSVLPQLLELARQLNLPIVATNQCLYESPHHAPALELLRRVDSATPLAREEELQPPSSLFYFRSPDEMVALFRNAPEAIQNTLAIADRCAVELPLGSAPLMPQFPFPPGVTARAFLEAACRDGLRRRYPDWETPDAPSPRPLTKKKRRELEKRLAHEIDTICQMGFVSYFAIVADIVAFAKRHGIPVGPGRGSAAGSLVSYLLGITDIDPLDFDLLFERFLNPARKKMPDIDIDFCERRRGEVLRYVREKYGNDHVAQIATFSTLRYKAALRDVARILNIPDAKADKWCLLLADFERSHTGPRLGLIDQALSHCDPLREEYLRDPQAKFALDLARLIEDLPRNLSTHAAGVVIAPQPLRTLLPLTSTGPDELLTQFDMYAVERLGLLKIDLLGLTTLTIIDDTRSLIAATRGLSLDLHSLPLDDDATYATLQRGDLLGVFQLETSAGMRRLVVALRVSSFHDLIATLALYRPGAMHQADAFIARKHHREPVTYPHPKLEPVLKETFGIFLYQEQVMQALHVLAGYSLAEADSFRQMISKKLTDQVQHERSRFLSRATEKGLTRDEANQLFDELARFANYGFNKSHAAAYAVLAYWTAYLKTHFPAQFYAALLNTKSDPAECFHACRQAGIPILPPDVNRSTTAFTVEQQDDGSFAIRYSLEAIRNVGPAGAAELIRERSHGGPFRSIDDLCRRINHRVVTRKTIDSLIKAGACDCFNQPRQVLCFIADDVTASWERGLESALQRSFFDAFDEANTPPSPSRAELETLGEWPPATRLAFEKEMLGLYLTGHPLDDFAATWRAVTTADARDAGYRARATDEDQPLLEAPPGPVVMGGLLLDADYRMSKKGRIYGILSCEDFYGSFEALLWAEQVDEFRNRLNKGQIWFFKGSLKTSLGKTSLSIDALVPAADVLRVWARRLRITLTEQRATTSQLRTLAELLRAHPGSLPLELAVQRRATDELVLVDTKGVQVAPTETLLRAIQQLCGETAARVLV
ncbi:MAG: DNA polymerase III subunit alpha [bacterium]|nr:DNA polymerase III subunit alpha [bacterium]